MAEELTQDFNMPSDIPTSETVSAGTYNVRIAGAKAEERDKDGTSYLQVAIEFRITAPEQFQNVPLWDRIQIGTDKDPMGRDPNTWKEARGGGRRVARLLMAAGVANSGSLQQNLAALRERHLTIKVTEYESKSNGQIYNNIPAYYPLGEKEVGLVGDAGSAGGVSAMPATRPLTADVATPARPLNSGGYE